MIDLRILRENPELIKKNCARRGSAVNVDTLIALDVKILYRIFQYCENSPP